MKLVLQTLDKQTFEVIVEDSATLLDLRKQFEAVKNHPADQLKLIFSGAVLTDDTKLLTDYKLVEGSKIVVLLQKPKPTPVATPTPTVNTVSSTTSTTSATTGSNATTDAATEQPSTSTEQSSTSTSTTPANANPTPFNLFTAAAAQGAATGIPAGAQGIQQMLTQLLTSNPQILMQMLMTDPQMAQTAQQNPQAFLQMLNNPEFLNSLVQFGEDMGEVSEFEGVYEELTDDQKKDIDEMVEMGFDFNDIVQYYCLNDHNKEITMNILLNQQLDEAN